MISAERGPATVVQDEQCPLLRVDPAERPRLEEILDNVIARTAEAEHQGWLGEVEKLRIYLASAEGKLGRFDEP